jgi:hypothetical protein
MTDVTTVQERHPATVHLIGLFTYDHLSGHLRDVSRECCDLASLMFSTIPDSPELTTGLRKLLEAKDCFVRAAVSGGRVSE